MISGGSKAYDDKHRLKVVHHEVHMAELVVPRYLQWLEFLIIFDHHDHPEKISHPGTYPLIVEPIVGSKHLSKLLMDGGRDLNIMYVETFDDMGIKRSALHPSLALFHGIILGLPARVDHASRHVRRPLQLLHRAAVVRGGGLLGSYNSILRRPYYAKFMVVPNYAYFKLKMLGPRGIITVPASFKATYTCEQANCELASTLAMTRELAELQKAAPRAPKCSQDWLQHLQVCRGHRGGHDRCRRHI